MIEPDNDKVKFITSMIKHNNLDEFCSITNAALGTQKSRGSLKKTKTPLGGWTVDMASDGNFDIVPLDSLPQARHVGALHLDVEGMEIDAIQGALLTLKNNTPL